jgi:hypothetical protein
MAQVSSKGKAIEQSRSMPRGGCGQNQRMCTATEFGALFACFIVE